MRLGWVCDPETVDVIGGADLCVRDLLEVVPEGIEVVPCPPGAVQADVDAYAVHNVVQYNASIIETLYTKPVIKMVYEQWWIGDPVLRDWLLNNASVAIFLSPPHREQFPWEVNVPVAIQPTIHNHLDRFQEARVRIGERRGTMWLAQMTGEHKGLDLAVDWAEANQEHVSFFGGGFLRPRESAYAHVQGQLRHEDVPAVMAAYQRFLFLPKVLDVCSRTIFEAHSSGMDLEVNSNVGAMWWLENHPDMIGDGAEMFWNTVRQVAGPGL